MVRKKQEKMIKDNGIVDKHPENKMKKNNLYQFQIAEDLNHIDLEQLHNYNNQYMKHHKYLRNFMQIVKKNQKE